RGDGVSVKEPRTTLLSQGLRRLLGRERFAVRSRLSHRVVGVGRGEETGRERERGCVQSTVITGTVQSLVVAARDRRELREERRLHEETLRVVRVQPHPLPLIRRQRTLLLPDAH